jgi:hypothetical protein
VTEVKTLVVDWKCLKKMGWPYSRAHTHRLMAAEVPDRTHKPKGLEVQRMIPNPDPFPGCHKLVNHRNAHPMWRAAEVLAYFEAHGLAVSDDWQNS